MKNTFNKNPLITFFGGLFCCFILFASCDNFLNGDLIKTEIEQAIAYNNAKEITVLLQPEEGTGSTLPTGNTKIKQGYDFEISFSENPAYSFVKWTAVTNDNARTIVSDGVVFEDATSEVTKVKISNDTVSIRILPVCEKRIEVSGEPGPGYAASGVSWNSPIHVEFTKALNPDSFIFDPSEIPEGAELKTNGDGKIWAYTLEGQTCFKNITITDANDLSLADYYDMPQVNGTNLTILASTVHPFEFERPDELKLIKVTLAKSITDTKNIQMTAEKSWRYQINNTTNEKASIVFANQTEGSTNVPSKDYSLGQKINISFKENEGYQFVRWDYDKSIILIEEPDSIETIALVIKPTETNTSTTIKAICAPCLTVATPYPVNDIGNLSVSKNESIRITFDHELPAEEECREQLENISIKIGSDSVKTNFKAPHIDGKTITIAADNSNLISVDKGETKTVTVTIPKDFYYEYEGKKIYAAKDYTWSYKINDTTINKTPVSFSATEEEMSGKQIRVEGTYLSSGTTKDMSVQQKWALEFPVSKGYKFDGWKLTAPVDYSVISTTEEQNEYKTSGVISILAQDSQTQQTQTLFALSIDTESPEKATLYSYGLITEGFTISAMETALPVVEYVKVNAINSIYDTPTTSCDSKIYIHFNKEMNVNEGETILASNGYISITKVGLSTMHYEDYFTSSWEDPMHKTTLVIKPINEIKTLVPNPTDLFDFVIKLNASKEFQDKDENTLQLSSGINNSFEIGYTITGVRESNPPTWEKYFVSNKKKGAAIDNTPFDEWNNDTSIYKKHHLSNSLYFLMTGSDAETGIDHLVVTETLKKSSSGSDVDSTSISAVYEFSDLSDSIYTFEGEHKFKSINDGILQVDFILVDKAGNESSVLTYYVIKDTQLYVDEDFNDAIRIPFDEKRYGTLVDEKDKLSETIIFSVLPQKYQIDVYKKSSFTYKKDINKMVFWSYDEKKIDGKENIIDPDSSDYYRLVHDPSKVTYLKIVFSDNFGNEKTFMRFIPAMADINAESFATRTDPITGDYYDIIPNNLDFYRALVQKFDMDSHVSVLYFRNNNIITDGRKEFVEVKNPKFKDMEDLGKGIPVELLKKKPGDYYFNVCIVCGNAGDPEEHYFVSSLSDSTLLIRVDENLEITAVKQGSRKYGPVGSISELSNHYSEPLYPAGLDIISITPETNTGRCNIQINGKFNRNSDFIYKLQAVNKLVQAVIDAEETKLFNLDLRTPAEYNIRLVLTHKGTNTEYYTEPLQLSIKQPTSAVYEVTSDTIKLQADCTSPTFKGSSVWWETFPFAYNIFYNDWSFGNADESLHTYPRDEKDGKGMYQNEDGKGELTYWILPSNLTSYWGSDFNEEELEEYNDTKKTITYDFNQMDYVLPHNGKHQVRIELPFDGLDEGNYIICIKAKDASGNYSYCFQPVFNKLQNTKLLYEVADGKITFTNPHSGAICESAGFYYLDADDNDDNAPIRWILSARKESIQHDPVTDLPESLSEHWGRIVGYSDIGYYDIEYVYIDYLTKKGTADEIVITQKNILTGLNGLQVYCDAPTLAHTLYCSKKLSETATENDIAVWENKGIETGIVVHDSDFTYGNDKYADIPSGYYYTTVVHFADGSKAMTEVKQK